MTLLFILASTVATVKCGFRESALVIFEDHDSWVCGGVLVSRSHVLTTHECALSTKKHQLTPRRVAAASPSNQDVVTGMNFLIE